MTGENATPTSELTLRLVELFFTRPEGWSPQELLLELDLSRSSLFALLRTLKTLGYVEQAGKRGRYLPGARLLAWRAPHAPATQDLLTAFYQEVETAAVPVGADPASETLALALPAGNGGWIIAAQVESSQQVRSAFVTGQLIAELPAAAHAVNPSPASEVAENGYSLSTGSQTFDLALPICRDGRTPEAILLLTAPAFRWTGVDLVETCLPGLREIAAHLSYRLGAPFYAPYQTHPRGLQVTAPLSQEEITAFLRGPYAASLACVRPDGRPHVIPVWQEWDGRDFFVIAWQGAQWADYVQANANVSLTVDEPWAPLRRVVVQGCAYALDATPADLDRLLQRMTRRYLGRPAAPGLLQQVQRAFRIQPGSLRGWRGLL